jgi:hypothetical protein
LPPSLLLLYRSKYEDNAHCSFGQLGGGAAAVGGVMLAEALEAICRFLCLVDMSKADW